MLVVALLDHAKRKGAGDSGLGATESDSTASQSSPQICDVGTGSGILAVCAAKYLPQAHVTAIDVSPAALEVARRNAERHQVADRITFLESNLFAAVPADARFDSIVSNPPYVSTAEMADLPPDVQTTSRRSPSKRETRAPPSSSPSLPKRPSDSTPAAR